MSGPIECPNCKNFYYGPVCPYCGSQQIQQPQYASQKDFSQQSLYQQPQYSPSDQYQQQPQYPPPLSYQQPQYQPPQYQPPPYYQQQPPQYGNVSPMYPGQGPSPIAGSFERASTLKRFLALLIDGFIVIVILFVISSFFSGIYKLDQESFYVSGYSYLIFALVQFLYWCVFEGTTGKTPGKSILGLLVIKEDGSAMNFSAAFIRNVLRIIDSLPGFYLIGLIVILSSEKNQRLGDLAAKTLVVEKIKQLYAPYPIY